MANIGFIWERWKHILIDVLALSILLNLLYFSFFFEKTYLPVSISTEVFVSEKAQVWYVYKEKYSEKRFFSKKKELAANENHIFKFDILSNTSLDYIGLFWKSEEGSSLNIRSYSYKIDENFYKNEKDRNTIEYVSLGSIVEQNPEGVKISSTDSKRNWIMLNHTHRINERRDKKVHNPISLWGNFIIIIIIILFRGAKSEKKYAAGFWHANMSDLNIRQALLSLWVFIMPFWMIASHSFMTGITLFMLISVIKKKKFGSLVKVLKVNYAFYLFYVWIVISSCFTSKTHEILDVAVDYCYFLFMPIIFSAFDKQGMEKLFDFLKKGLLTYFILLLVYTITRYFKVDQELSFVEFFKLDVEIFWHTSYLSVLILLLFIKYVKTPLKNNVALIVLYIAALSFMYLVDARMPFLVGLFLLSYRVPGMLNTKKAKFIFIISSVLLSTILIGYFLIRNQKQGLNTSHDITKLDARITIWEVGLERVKENLIFGVGPKNTVDFISEAMDGNSIAKYRNYNLHNQFLETLLGSGLISLGLLLIILYHLYKRKTIYGATFAFSCALLFMVESYFVHQAGIILFTFWYCFFIRYKIE